MKILLVSLNFSPELTGIGKYSGEMAEGLVARGHEVSVVCAPPHYPQRQVAEPYRAYAYCTERPLPGLTVHRCPIWVPKRLGGLSRLLHLASFALSSLPLLMWMVLWQPRIVFVVAPALFCAPGAWLVARLTGAKAWLHVQDFEIDAAFELGLLGHPLLRWTALFGERVLLNRFDAVSTISRRMLGRLAAKGVAPQHTVLLPNWADLAVLSRLDRSDPRALCMRLALGIGADPVVCLFSGTVNRKQGLGLIIDAARRLQGDRRIVFVVCGNGELRPGLEASAEGLRNVRFLDLRPSGELNALLAMADIHLLPQLRCAADLVMPSKLVGMLASGRPVVAAAMLGTEIADVVTGRGLVTEPECVDAFVAAINTLVDDAARRRRLGAAARDYAERALDAKGILDRLEQRLLALDLAPTGRLAAFGPYVAEGRADDELHPAASGTRPH
jgi:colanic acid biosynthesis glycosyl transferase WcaI